MSQLNPCAFSCFSTFHCLYWGFSQQHLFPISPSLTQTQKQWWNQVTKNPMFYYEKLHDQDMYIRTISSLHWERFFTCFIGQTVGMGSNLCGEKMHFSKHCVHYCFALVFFSFYILYVNGGNGGIFQSWETCEQGCVCCWLLGILLLLLFSKD